MVHALFVEMLSMIVIALLGVIRQDKPSQQKLSSDAQAFASISSGASQCNSAPSRVSILAYPTSLEPVPQPLNQHSTDRSMRPEAEVPSHHGKLHHPRVVDISPARLQPVVVVAEGSPLWIAHNQFEDSAAVLHTHSTRNFVQSSSLMSWN